MAICPEYSSFRARFTAGITGADGWPAWNPVVLPVTMTAPTQVSTLTFPITITLDASSDPTLGVDRYDWYLSQRTDVVANQYLTLTQAAAATSGVVNVGLSALGTSTWVPLGNYTADAVYRLFFDVYLYAIRKSDQHIFYVDFTRSLFAQY